MVPRAVPVLEAAQVGQQPPHGASINKKASLDKGSACGPLPTLQINVGNIPLSQSERRGGVFFVLGLGFFSDSLSTCDFPLRCKLFSKVCTHLAVFSEY